MNQINWQLIDRIVTLNPVWLEPLVEFFVPGEPATAGSKRGMQHPTLRKCLSSPEDAQRLPELLEDEELARKMRRVMMIPDNERSATWRSVVATFALQAYLPNGPVHSAPLLLWTEFVLKRRQGDFGTGGNADRLKPSAPTWSIVNPDTTKMLRCAEDALKGITWIDDSQVALQVTGKRYASPGEPTGAYVRIFRLHEHP